MLEPEEQDFVYRTRRPQAAMDPAMRRMALGAGGVSALVIVVALLWSGVRGTGFGPPPVITAPPGPLRVLPVNPGGLTVPEANEQIMSGNNPIAPPQLAPSGPAPDIAQLDQEAGIGAPPLPAGGTSPGAAPPQVAPPASSPPAAEVRPSPPATTAAHGGVAVQLAATGSEDSAMAVWGALQHKMPDLLGGKNPEIISAVVAGRTVWRLRLGGFAGTAAARDFCAVLRAKGVACTVASF